MDRVILNLEDGTNRICLIPQDEEMRQALLDCGHNPLRVKGKTLSLLTPEKNVYDIPADEVSSIEVWPPHVLIKNLLSPEEVDSATAHVLAREGAFTDAAVHAYDRTGHDKDSRFRSARVLHDVKPVGYLVGEKLRGLMPRLWPTLGLPKLNITRMECQITAHGDGDFFATHADNGIPELAHRRVSYVYYFHQEPKRFTGGHLKFYYARIKDGISRAGALAAEIEPPRNSLIVFPSHNHHEVTQITSDSRALADQRLTINGWLGV